jgi:DTW domain-containing protein YfiP
VIERTVENGGIRAYIYPDVTTARNAVDNSGSRCSTCFRPRAICLHNTRSPDYCASPLKMLLHRAELARHLVHASPHTPIIAHKSSQKRLERGFRLASQLDTCRNVQVWADHQVRYLISDGSALHNVGQPGNREAGVR